MRVIMKRVVVTYMLSVRHMYRSVPWHLLLDHEYSKETRNKSETWCAGGNPLIVPDTIYILDYLMSYVPVHEDQCRLVPCHGDGITIEAIVKAKMSRVFSRTPQFSFSGLV